MLCQGAAVPHHNQFPLGSCQCHIQAALIRKKTNLSPVVGSGKADQHQVPFLPLKSINRIDGDQFSKGSQIGKSIGFKNQMTQSSYLRRIRGNQSNGPTLFFKKSKSNAKDRVVEVLAGKLCLLRIESTEAFGSTWSV